MAKARIGFIGAGRIADLHALAYVDNPTGELHAVADSAPGRAAARAAEWGAGKAYEDYRDLLANPEVDGIEILLPHFLHKDVAIAALKAGKHVSLQKPMAVNLDDADAIVEAAGRSDAVFRVLDNYLSYAPYRYAKRLVDEGEIGEPQSFRINAITGSSLGGWDIPAEAMAWRDDPAKSGGSPPILDLGAHLAASICYFMGPVERVHTFSDSVTQRAGNRSGMPAVISCKFEGAEKYGVWTMTNSPELAIRTDYYPGEDLVEIGGSKGVLWINRCTARMLDAPPITLYRDGRTRHFDGMETDWGDSFRTGGMEFTDAIVNGTPVAMSAGFARSVLAFQLAAVRSAEEHREVTLAEMDAS